jgi:hypothetical protein
MYRQFTIMLLVLLFSLRLSWAVTTTITPASDARTAAAGLAAHDTLIFKGGTYQVETIRLTAKGTPGSLVVIMAAPGETPVITGISSSHNLISVRSAEYMVIDGLTIDGTPEGVDPLKFESGYASHHVTIQNCEIKNYRGVGINSKGEDHHITVRHCHIHHSIGGHGEGFYVGNHDGSTHPHHWVIENNWIHDTKGSQGDGIELKWGCWAITVRHNVVYNTQYPGILYYGYNGDNSDGSKTCLIEGNVVWGIGEAIGCYADVIVRNNIVLNSSNCVQSFTYSGHQSPENVEIYNNTFYDCARIYLGSWDQARKCVFANNAAYSITNGLQLGGTGTLYNNMGDVSHTSFTASTAAADLTDAVNSNFYPTRTSALVNQATGQHVAEYDFNGRKRDANPDVGAYEWVGDGKAGWSIQEGYKVLDSLASFIMAKFRLPPERSSITGSPNPFFSGQAVKFSLKGNLPLVIYSAPGEIVRTLTKTDGNTWNGRNSDGTLVPAGTYYFSTGNRGTLGSILKLN